nr:hypothetical protein [uncultured bacterium]
MKFTSVKRNGKGHLGRGSRRDVSSELDAAGNLSTFLGHRDEDVGCGGAGRDRHVRRINHQVESWYVNGHEAIGIRINRRRTRGVDSGESRGGGTGLESCGSGGLRIVERDNVLDLFIAINARESVDSCTTFAVTVKLSALPKGYVSISYSGELAEGSEQRMGWVEVVICGCGGRPNQVIIVVGGDSAGKHVLTSLLVTPVTNKTLLITIINHRNTPAEEHQGVCQPRAS